MNSIEKKKLGSYSTIQNVYKMCIFKVLENNTIPSFQVKLNLNLNHNQLKIKLKLSC